MQDDWSNSCEGDWNSQGGGGNSNNTSSNQNTNSGSAQPNNREESGDGERSQLGRGGGRGRGEARRGGSRGGGATGASVPQGHAGGRGRSAPAHSVSGGGGGGKAGTADEGKATVVEAGQTDAAGRKLQQQQSRFDRMPPRFQKRREFERQRNGVSGSGGGGGSSSNNGGGGGGGGGGGSKRGRGTPVSSSVLGSGGVGVVLTPANKPGVKEGTPETTEEADWETASESSDPEARKENKEKASNPAPKPDHRKGSKTDRKIGGGSWAPSSGGGSSQGRNSLGKESKVDGPGAPQSASQQRFGEKKAPHKNERNKSGPTSGKGTKNETTVNQVHEIKLNPNMVHQALSEVNNKSKPKQEKANPLEGIDLNNYASK